MIIALTGASGFMGSALSAALLEAGHELLVLTTRSAQPGNLPSGVRSVAWPPGEPLPEAAKAWRPDRVVHLGWSLSGRGDWSAQASQVERAAALVPLLRASGGFVGLGSSDEYGAAAGVLREDVGARMPISAYGWAKSACGQLFESVSQSAGVPSVWLRPFVVYGPGQEGDMLLPYAIRAAIAGAPAEFTEGRQLRDFVFVDDVVRVIVEALALEESTSLNVGTGEGISVRAALGCVARLGAVDNFQYGVRAMRSSESGERVADVSRLRSTLGWVPSTDLETGLSATFAWYRERA